MFFPIYLKRISLPVLLLALGDLLLLAGFAFYFVFFQPPIASSPYSIYLDLAGSILPFVVVWLVLGRVVGHFDYQCSWRIFLFKAGLAWGLTALVAEILVALYWLIGYRIYLTLSVVIFNFLTGFFCMLAWRIAFKGTCQLITQRRWLFIRNVARLGLAILILALLGMLWLRWFSVTKYSEQIYPGVAVPSKPVAIVFGAGVYAGGPSAVLRERVNMAAALFKAGKVERVLLSGDGRAESFSETAAMEAMALALEIPESAIFLDPLGYDTYSSCLRARYEYDITQAVLVSQSFHLPRALLTCNGLGVESHGVVAAQSDDIKSAFVWNIREIPATFVAWWHVLIKMVFG